MYPEQPSTPSVQSPGPAPVPQVYGQVPPPPGVLSPPPPSAQPTSSPASGRSRKKLVLIVVAIVLGLLIIATLVAVMAGGKSGKKAPVSTTSGQPSQGPAPASSLILQQNIDAINQNLSGLDDNTDFAPNALSDTALQGS